MKLFFTLTGAIIAIFTQAQFTNVTAGYPFSLVGTSPQSGNGVSFYDYDKDGWDDLTIGQASNPIMVYHNDLGDYNIAATFPNTGDVKSILWIDYDNDGDADLFFTVMNQSAKLYRNDGEMVFTEVTSNLNLPITNGKSFGAAWGDYDNDGNADVYICNYSTQPGSHTNWLLHNNGDGTFTNVTNEMGVGDDYKPTYQCTFHDVDMDGLQDIYVVNDFGFGNQLYLNNGSGFTAAGADFNLDLEMEGMSISWNDLDHDMDWDVFITDNTEGNKLMMNEGGLFADIAASAGVQVNSTCWGSMWLDYDHDTHADLHVATSLLSVNNNQNYLFHNNGDLTFTDNSIMGDAQISFATAKGDKNNDGYWDFIVMKQYPAAVGLYQNDGGENHWAKIGLTGTVSNRDGIGAIIRHYAGGQQFMAGTFCGEGFMEQDSQYEILSLGSNEFIDSLTVTWPSGWVDRYYDLAADTFYALTEGETYAPIITNVSNQMLCPSGGEIELLAEQGDSWLWSDASEEQSYFVTEPGIYSCTIRHESGIVGVATYEVIQYDDLAVSSNITQPSCFGLNDGCISLIFDGEVSNVIWSNELSGTEICELAVGNYQATITAENGCDQTFFVDVTEPEILVLNTQSSSVCFGVTTNAVYEITGGTEPYELNWFEEDPDALSAGFYMVSVLDANGCEAFSQFEVVSYDVVEFNYFTDTICFNQTIELNYSVDAHGFDYTIDWNDLDPEQVTAGDYMIEVIDQNLCSLLVNIQMTESPQIILSSEIQNANNGDNGSVEIMITGGVAPYNIVWNGGEIQNPLTNIGSGDYTATITDAAGCESQIDAEVIDLLIDEESYNIMFYPNPANDFIILQSKAGTSWSIISSSGQICLNGLTDQDFERIDVSMLAAGSYIFNYASLSTMLIIK